MSEGLEPVSSQLLNASLDTQSLNQNQNVRNREKKAQSKNEEAKNIVVITKQKLINSVFSYGYKNMLHLMELKEEHE
jgi:hypothetical protein